ncbi:hypothetical protein PTQ35_03120 [Campylobacter sp. 46490-21]|nr:hypothetical protein [Campylobacter magnus]MDD0847806.1 hypothetical protein [Campylobacter magnus]
MVKKYSISQAKMSKFYLLFALLGVVFLGCEQPKTTANIQAQGTSSSHTISQAEQKQLEALDNSCVAGNVDACMQVAGTLYNKGYYTEAAAAYDALCSKLQHLKACLILADMFDDGLGVVKSSATAKEIWQKACYNGDKDSCKKMK